MVPSGIRNLRTAVDVGDAGLSNASQEGARQRLELVIFGINYAPELTGIAPYTSELSEHFARQGHTVRVVTGIPHYPEWRHLPIPPRDRRRSNPAIHRYGHFVPKRPNAIGRMLYEASWFVSASRGLIQAVPDAVIGVVPSLSGGLLAVTAAYRWRVPVGLIVQDLMGPAAVQSGYRGGGAVAGLTEKLEKAILRRADQIAIVSDGFRHYLHAAGLVDSKIRQVRHWTHPGMPTESRKACRSRLGWASSDFICLHAGNMGQKQGLDTVLDAAVLLEREGIRLVLAGNGNDRGRLASRINVQRISNVSLLDLQPAGLYEATLEAADVLLISQRPSVSDMSLPSKLASYFAAGRPVVAAVAPGCQTASELNAANAGIVVNASRPAALAEALVFLRRHPGAAATFGANGRQFAKKYLTAAACLSGYDAFLDELICEKQHAFDSSLQAEALPDSEGNRR